MKQFDLFSELASKNTDPIIGLRIKLSPCRCRCDIARIVKGEWLNVPLACEGCGKERGRLTYATITFIRNVIEIWGRPTAPIELKQSSLSKQFPHDAEAADASRQIGPEGAQHHEYRK